MKKFNVGIEKEICREYCIQKITQQILAKKYNCSRDTIMAVLRRNGVPQKNNGRKKHISIDLEWIIIQDYKNGKTISEIIKLYQIPYRSVKKILSKYNIQERKIGSWVRKYEVNEDLLDKIDSVEKAIFIGLFFSDGYNSQKIGFVTIGLKESDKEYLEFFNRMFNKNRPLVLNNTMAKLANEKQISMFVMSRKICEKLAIMGAPQKKSLVLEFPKEEHIPKYLIPAFLRGYFEGDGSLIRTETLQKQGQGKKIRFYKRLQFMVSIAGTENFLNSVKNYLSELKINSQIYIKNRNFGQLRINGHAQVKKFLDHIYSFRSDIALKRKYNRYLELCDLIKNKNYSIKLGEITKSEKLC